MATEQIAVRLPTQLLVALDDIVDRGVFDSRSAAVRAGLEAVLRQEAERLIDHAIVDGYTKHPPTEDEHAAAVASLRAAILDEPW